MSRWLPKAWPAPKSRRTRHGALGMMLSSVRILQDLYPMVGERPWWAKLALARGWMSERAYLDVPLVPLPKGKSFKDRVHGPSPIFGLMPKRRA